MSERQSERKQRRIMEEAERHFLSLGLRAASVDQIAAAAGVSKVTLYRHYGSKDDLFVECVRRITDRHFCELDDAVAAQPTATAGLAAVFAHNIESRSRYQPAFIRDMMGIPHIWERVRGFRETKAAALITSILESGIASGEFRDMHLGHTTRLIMSFGEAVPRLYPYDDEQEAERFLQSLYDFLTGALTYR
ncbi:MAG: TetR/AcrR family transcriptional regulator [Spirochaetaceae bacterium]|nr:MAG: TetR/AcrR family transcriptional regulator [Spirochaetaceae bacterium]